MKHAAGYSRKSLVEKLGIKPGFLISFVNEPPQHLLLLGPLPPGVEVVSGRKTRLDLVHLFARDRLQLIKSFPQAIARIKPNGILWVSWPKRTSSLRGDLHENSVRQIGLSHGLVDVKVAAIDEDWSGLKFVHRLKDRR